MDRSGASAYVYAKASGMLAKSFVGPRTVKLFEAKSLAELWSLLFKKEVPLVPEGMLAQMLEQEAELEFVKDFQTLLGAYRKPDPVSLLMFRSYDFSNLKNIASALRTGETVMPAVVDIGRYRMLDYGAWPDIARITKDTPVSWYSRIPDTAEETEWENLLDLQYIHMLWNTVQKLPGVDRRPVEALVREEIVLQNIIWAIRLRVYYDMKAEEIIPRLAPAGEAADRNDILAGPAVRILGFAVDTYADWENWKYAELLNPHEEGVVWAVDPRWVQQSVNVRINRLAYSQFHQYPFTVDVLISWFKIKQHELNCIRTAAEGLRLNVPDTQLKQFVGVQ